MTVRTASRTATGRAFVAEVAQLLPKAEASGDRLITALYLIMVSHPARVETDDQQRSHLTCAECRPGSREPRDQYPCRTAQQAFWALDAILR